MSLPQEEITRRIEFVLDLIADAIIQNPSIISEVINKNQKTIRNGIVTIGRTNLDRLVIYSSDIDANPNDLLGLSTDGKTLEQIVIDIPDINQVTIDANDLNNISLSYPLGTGEVTTHYITDLLSETITNDDGTTTIRNPHNVGQFLSFIASETNIDVSQAQEFLDTNIFELLPDSSIRQEQIDDLFSQIDELLPPPITDEEWGLDDNGRVNRLNETSDWEGSQDYYLNNSISSAQNNEEGSIEEEDGFITRLEKNTSDVNSLQSIESLRNRLNIYLKDVDEQEVELQDERPEYENQSEGYLKFRNLNQGIIIRNTNTEFLEGLNPNNPTWLDTGFTITMWVRFLDKSSQGTLFNYGNPTRGYLGQAFNSDAFGFKLETYNLNKDDLCPHPDYETWGSAADNIPYANNFFEDNQSARFVRLVVNDFRTDASGNPTPTKALRDSHIGALRSGKLNSVIPLLGENDNLGNIQMGSDSNPASEPRNALRLLNTTFIPMDFTEWYFICASYNPNIFEDQSKDFPKPAGDDTYEETPDFWMNNINPSDNLYVNNSGYGNRCKVEIISRSDLLRARGFKVE